MARDRGPRIIDIKRTHSEHEPRPTAARTEERARDAFERYGLVVRDKHVGDIPKLTKDWIRSYRSAPAVAEIGSDIYAANQHRLIEELWDDGVWLVAHPAPFPTFIVGWLCGELSDRGPIVHYVYVRHSFHPDGDGGEKVPARGRGIARALVETFTREVQSKRYWFTHMTRDAKLALSGRMAPAPGAAGWEYNPYLAWRRVGK